ncbi:MAG: hypothetical protein AB7T49_10540 [Oligoflexales bacterium]
MKFLATALLSLTLSASAFAQPSDEPAVTLFKNDAAVQAEIQKIKDNAITELQDGATYSISIAGGCGFAGCDEDVLVIHVLEFRGTNPQWTSVRGIVHFPSIGDPTVKLVKIEEQGF